MPKQPPSTPSPTSPEDQQAAVARARAAILAGASQRVASTEAGALIGVTGRAVQRWASRSGEPLPGYDQTGMHVNAVRAHLVMSMQRQREMAQDLLRVAYVLVADLTRQARKGAAAVDTVLFARVSRELGELYRIDQQMLLQVGRAEGDEGAARAAGAVAELTAEAAAQWARDRTAFRAEAGGGQ